MKASDLMIGDKLKTVFSQKIVKVKEIKQNCIYTEDNGYEYNEIEPIPLTPEILEKNGWEHWCDIIGNTIGYFEGDNHNYLEITIGDDGIWWSINDNEYYILRLKYVHELQHALKMNGIKKEIVL